MVLGITVIMYVAGWSSRQALTRAPVTVLIQLMHIAPHRLHAVVKSSLRLSVDLEVTAIVEVPRAVTHRPHQLRIDEKCCPCRRSAATGRICRSHWCLWPG